MNKRTERFVAFGRGAVAWERVWPALWPASGLVALFVAAALFDLFARLSWPVHALVLSAVITGVGVLLYLGLKDIRWPGWDDGAKRVERDSRLAHRPISEAGDRIAAGAGDPWAEELWRAHLRNRLARALKLRVALPSSGLARKDPRALRFVALLLLIAGFVIAGRSALDRIAAAFLSQGTGNGATIDAWIDPPTYTGEAPVYLGPNTGHLSVPIGSFVNLRVHGADHAPGLSADTDATFGGGSGEYQSTFKLTSSSTVRVRSSGRTLGAWNLSVIPDDPPSIAFAEKPSPTKRGALKITYVAGDDYGVVAVRAIITPHGRHAKPLIVSLPTTSISAKSMKVTAYQDLTEHPYAGLDVDVVLEATDALGQKGVSKPMRITLPARTFTDPLARALIELRQNLASGDRVAEERVTLTLDALSIAPDHFYQSSPGVYLGLRAAYWALKNPHRGEDVAHVEQLLWQIALSLEQGGLLAAADQLRLLQQLLAQALAQGAPQSVIDSLLQRYQDALQRYLQSLAQNGAPQTAQQQPPPGAKAITPDDLQALLKAIQQMEQSGDREGALQMLALLQDILENMKTAQDSGSGGSGEDKAMRDAQQALGSLFGQQRGLMDKTFKQEQGVGNPSDGGGSGLSKQQGGLRDQLNKILKGLGDPKNPVRKNLEEAGKGMDQSQQQLGGNDFQGSGDSQKQVLESLKQALQSLSKQESQQMGQKPGENGSGGEEADPLGRATGATGSVKLPSASDLQRARGILLELRKRAGERGRPKEELDYIDRLLKQF